VNSVKSTMLRGLLGKQFVTYTTANNSAKF